MDIGKDKIYRAILAGLVLLFSMRAIGCGGQSKYVKGGGSEGQKLYSAKCASCHRLRSPAEHPAEKWAEYVEKYGNKIGLTQEQKKQILEYLTSQ